MLIKSSGKWGSDSIPSQNILSLFLRLSIVSLHHKWNRGRYFPVSIWLVTEFFLEADLHIIYILKVEEIKKRFHSTKIIIFEYFLQIRCFNVSPKIFSLKRNKIMIVKYLQYCRGDLAMTFIGSCERIQKKYLRWRSTKYSLKINTVMCCAFLLLYICFIAHKFLLFFKILIIKKYFRSNNGHNLSWSTQHNFFFNKSKNYFIGKN